MSRVTLKDLEAIVARINQMTGNPAATYVRRGQLVAQVGNYHLSGAYGGWALHQVVNEGGAIRDVLGVGHVPKKELQRLLFAFIRGLTDRLTVA